LRWLEENYSYVKYFTELIPLENTDKAMLMEECRAEANHFWDYIEASYGVTGKIPISEIYDLMENYCKEN
jgi:hypothetical protein